MGFVRSAREVRSHSDTWADGLIIAQLLGSALPVRLIPLAFGIESTDILLYRQQAMPVVEARNVYAVTRNVVPYAPVSMFYPALCLELSSLVGIPFHVVIKLFAILADVGIVAALTTMGRALLGRRRAIRGAALYALNPVSMLVASFRLGMLGQLACLYYLLLFTWEIVFVLAIT